MPACPATPSRSAHGRLTEVKGLVEKPRIEDAPSNLIVSGRYILQPDVMQILDGQEKGAAGEIQLTDALQFAAKNKDVAGGVRGIVFRGRRYDTGDKLDFIKATLRIAIDRDDIGPDLRSWLKDFTKSL